jgi:hypothetical protein
LCTRARTSIGTWGRRRYQIRRKDIAAKRTQYRDAGWRKRLAVNRNASPRTVERPYGELRHGNARPTGSDCGQYSAGIISHRLGFNCVLRRIQARAAHANNDLASGMTGQSAWRAGRTARSGHRHWQRSGVVTMAGNARTAMVIGRLVE